MEKQKERIKKKNEKMEEGRMRNGGIYKDEKRVQRMVQRKEKRI